MFGPNVIPGYSHRDKAFSWLYAATLDKLAEIINDPDRDILLLSGSGTLANESVFFSSALAYTLITDGLFSRRLADTQKVYGKPLGSRRMGVYYETSISEMHDISSCSFVDCISAFPYYSLPDADICTTVSSKQLGASTGLSIAAVKRSAWNYLDPEVHSYLSLAKYRNKMLTGFTPNTPAIDSISSLYKTLLDFDLQTFRDKISSRRDMLVSLLDARDIRHYGTGPVLTIDIADFPKPLIEQYSLYTNSGNVQIFLWSGTDAEYKFFSGDLCRK